MVDPRPNLSWGGGGELRGLNVRGGRRRMREARGGGVVDPPYPKTLGHPNGELSFFSFQKLSLDPPNPSGRLCRGGHGSFAPGRL